MADDSFLQTIAPVTHDLGAFKVHRTLPARERTMVGPFIFVDEFGPARLPAGRGMDVRPHPHINLATVTYLFEGAIEHRDSIGSLAVIGPGAINLMTAGSGIVHSERSPQAIRAEGPSLYGMQTWLALPDGGEEIAPAFDQVGSDGLPLLEDGAARARVLMGGEAFSTRRYVFWNFVSSSRDRISQAKEDWKALRFAMIPGDDQEFIPLPEIPTTVSYP